MRDETVPAMTRWPSSWGATQRGIAEELVTAFSEEPTPSRSDAATLEHLHDVNQCRALFATHYHELTVLQSKLTELHNATMKVREWKDEIVFLHEVVGGTADRSYGLHVAKLAGLPASVVKRAEKLLKKLEQNKAGNEPVNLLDELPLFASGLQHFDEPKTIAVDHLREKLDSVLPDELSPREALVALYELKKLAIGDPK